LDDDALAQRIEDDFQNAGLDQRRLAMLQYARKLTETPAQMQAHDIDQLRSVGFTDLDVLQLCEVVSYYAYANRIADGLGVALEGS